MLILAILSHIQVLIILHIGIYIPLLTAYIKL